MMVKQHNLSAKEREELLDPFPVESAMAPTLNNRSLPYEELDGLRFERLCYEILCSDGKNPRYNGKSGQQDYGVDIVTERQDTVTVYQCKNISDRQSLSETVEDIRRAYSKVVERWVGEKELPNPTQFVYCSRQKLDGINDSVEYTPWRDSAFKKQQIDIQLWGRETLDSRLRDLPAVVSGVFSDRVARIFCNENSLPQDSNWERLQHAKSEYPTLREFYTDWKKDRLFIDPDLKEWFSSAVSASSVVLLQGVPGTGKTTTTLSLLATLKNRPERIYYTVISNFEKIPQLLDSVKKRAQLPSVFVLDDCHSAPDLAVELIQRLKGSLLSPNYAVSIKFVLLIRGTPEEEEGTYSDSVKRQLELGKDSAKSIPLSDGEQLLQVLKKRLPHINPITKCHAEHVFNLTGGNLKLANLAVNGVDSADELLLLDGSSVKQNVHRLYISRKKDADGQRMKNLCALAMFDITPLTDYLVLSEDFLDAGLITRLYSPTRVRFLHSSLAEVLFYVLVDMDEGVPDNWNERIKQELIRYFEHLCVEGQSQLDSFLLNLSSSQLHFPEFDIDRIISEFVGSSEFKALLTFEPGSVRVSVLRRLVARASPGTSEALKAINDAICGRLKYLYGKTEAWNEEELADFSNGIFGLSKSSPDHLRSLESQLTVYQLITKITQSCYIFELFSLLQYSSPSRAGALIAALESTDIDALVDKTVEQQRSVGTLHMALRDLGQKTVEIDGEKLNLLTELEQIVTARHLRELIVNNGTVFELFKFLEHSSPSRAGALIAALESTDIDALVDKTVEQQRSVGTLHMALRDLGQKTVEIDGEKLNLLTELEQIVTARHLRELIVNNGTVFELFKFLEHSSPSRAGALIAALESTDIDSLVDKTIEQQRSVESLHYTFGGLRRYRSLLGELLKVLSPPILARLIVRAGTLNALMSISSQLPEEYLCELRVTISKYPRDEWQELVFRGLPNNLVNFLSQDIEHYPDEVRNLLGSIVASEGTRLLRKSSWFELNTANYDSDEPITTILREKLEHLLALTPADALLDLDFKEATSAVSIMWRQATPKHDFLNARLWDLLPPERQWPKDYGFGFLSNVLQHLSHKDFSRQNAEKLLCKASNHALQVNWTKATPRLLFRFFWELWQASHHLSVSDPSQYFPESLSDEAIELLKKLLSGKKYPNSDKIALYTLAGLLLFIRPGKKRELSGIVKGRLTGLDYLCDEIHTTLGNNSLGFVPAYFALYGMGLVRSPSHNFTIELRMALKERFLDYPDTTQAVDTLFSDVGRIR